MWSKETTDPSESPDFGYERMPLVTIMAEEGAMILPDDEQCLASEAFLVADTDALCDLESRR